MVNETEVYQGIRDALKLSKELLLTVCHNPKCRREFKEPILLTIQSVTPPNQYKACPYCFAELEQTPVKEKEISNVIIEKEEVIESSTTTADDIPETTFIQKKEDSGRANLLKKVRSLIPSDEASKKEKSQDNFKLEKGKGEKNCPESFGYLANRPKDVAIPQLCLTCPKMVDCMLSPREE